MVCACSALIFVIDRFFLVPLQIVANFANPSRYRRADGLAFTDTVDKYCYKSDDGAVQDTGLAMEPFVKEWAGEVCEEQIETMQMGYPDIFNITEEGDAGNSSVSVSKKCVGQRDCKKKAGE